MDARDAHNSDKDTTTGYGFPGNAPRKIRSRTSRRRFSLQMPLPSVSRSLMCDIAISCCLIALRVCGRYPKQVVLITITSQEWSIACLAQDLRSAETPRCPFWPATSLSQYALKCIMSRATCSGCGGRRFEI